MILSFFFYHEATSPVGQGFLIIEDSLSHTVRQTTLGRAPLDEWSVRRRHLYPTTHNTHRHLCPRRHSKPLSQKARGRRPKP